MFSWRGVGKSLFTLGLANLLAGGEAMLRYRRVAEPQNVLVIDGEMPQSLLQERVREFVRPENLGRVKLLSPSMMGIARFNLFDDRQQTAILRIILKHGIKAVVLDAQGLLMPGDPLKAEFHAQRDALLVGYRNLGLTVIETHHGGKSREQRGSSRNDDVLDVQIRLKEPRDWQPGDGLMFELEYCKVRHGGEFESGYQVFWDGERKEWVSRSSATEIAVLEAHREGKKQATIAHELGINQATVSRILKRMAARGLVELNDKHARRGP